MGVVAGEEWVEVVGSDQRVLMNRRLGGEDRLGGGCRDGDRGKVEVIRAAVGNGCWAAARKVDLVS